MAFGRVGGTGALSFATFHHSLQNCTFAETVDLFEAPPEFQESFGVPLQGGILRNGATSAFGNKNMWHCSYGDITVRIWQQQPISRLTLHLR